jgi:amino acid adenylation domain-containing protein
VQSDKNVDLVTAFLAVLKTGAAYIPLDPTYPEERLKEMLIDADPVLRLTQETFRNLDGEARQEEAENLCEAISEDSTAYVIFTSGSTGRPKGTLTTHHNVLRLFEQAGKLFDFAPSDVWTLFHSCSFDFSAWELWGALLSGARLVVVPQTVSRSAADFHEVLLREQVTILNATPSAFAPLLRRQLQPGAPKLPLRYLILGGEALDFRALRPWFERYGDRQPRVVNGYGPTETTIFATFKFLTQEDLADPVLSNIGRPLEDLSLEIEDGELVIAGPGVARGYLNRPDLTPQKFVTRSGRPAYRSGDRVRKLPSGDFEFLGRIDDQVKVRGFRIELGEIESLLLRQPEVAQAGVCVHGSGAAARLEAFVVLRAGEDAGNIGSTLRERLQRQLPQYMLPTSVTVLPELPLNAHGKLDRFALAALVPVEASTASSFVARGVLESDLASIWGELLGRSSPRRDENFFDAGGSSLLGEVLLERIQDRLGIRVSMTDLLAHPTLSSLAGWLGTRVAEKPGDSPPPARGAPASGKIAVIAMEGRFPGARDVEEFWRTLCEGRECIRFFKPEEIDTSEPLHDAHYVPARGVIENSADFDASFFGFTKTEACALDPQQRLFLELCWRSLEKAGYSDGRASTRIGVYGGVSANTYFSHNVLPNAEVIQKIGLLGAQLLNEKDYVATRVAYKLDLKGPAISIHSACSTSLVAIAEACFAIREGRCDMALAGGASIRVPENTGHLFQSDAMLSRDGHTRSFGEDATGTVFSDGGGVVLLKRLEDALRDGDEVLAVVASAAINNDGSLKASFTAPSLRGQVDVIRAALHDAGLSAREISYVEAHGTATPLGDPLELEALQQAFRADTRDEGFCALGSVKSNFGHLVAAAGVAGFIKTVLALHKEKIPPTLGAERPTPQHDWQRSPFRLNRELKDWKGLRRAGVSSFGVGGTNAHVILESAPHIVEQSRPPPRPQLLLLSAQDPESLRRLSSDWATQIHEPANLADAAFTSAVGRRFHRERRWIVAETPAEARQLLARELPEPKLPADVVIDTGFLLPGQGAQYPGMGTALRAHDPLFRRFWEECEQHRRQAFSSPTSPRGSLLALEYALARTWMERGLEPTCLVGYSMGELAAAALSGVLTIAETFDLAEALDRIVEERCQRGGLLSVRLSVQDLRDRIRAPLFVAAENSALLSVVAGPEKELRELEAVLFREQIPTARVDALYPYHSPAMEPAVEPLRDKLKGLVLRAPRIPIFSSRKGRRITEAEALDPAHWAEILLSPVRFRDSFRQASAAYPQTAWLEVGPGMQLSTFARQSETPDRVVVPSLGMASHTELRDWLSAHGQLWSLGALTQVPLPTGARRRPFPLHPLRPERCWIEAPAPLAAQPLSAAIPASKKTLADAVREVFEEISGFDLRQSGEGTTFLDLGMDSLFLTQASTALEKKFHVAIPFRRLLDDLNCLALLTAFLESQTSTTTPLPAVPALRAQAPDTDEPASKTPFGAIARVSRSSDAFTPRQAESFLKWRREYEERTRASKRHAQEHRPHFADPRVVSGFKPTLKEVVYPIVVDRSKGSRLWDIDGNEYVDLLNGFGTNFLGHSPDFVVDAQKQQLDRGVEVGPSTPLAGECAQLFCEITGNERAAFCCTGSEAVLGCLRIARTLTGRDLVVVFSGSYHGIFDEVIVRRGKGGRAYAAAPGILPSNVGNIWVLDYGKPESLDAIRERAHEIAAVLVEPVQSRNPALQPAAFLRELRQLTTERDICLIFDEVITGLRSHPGGAQALFGVQADIASYGKVVGGGNPIGVIAGRARFMDVLDGGPWSFGDSSKPESRVTYFAGTYLRHPLALAAARSVLLRLRSEGPGLQERLNERARVFANELNELFRETKAPMEIHRFASLFRLVFTRDLPYSELLFLRLRFRGVHIIENFPFFLSVAHDENDLALAKRAFRDAITDMQGAGFLLGEGSRAALPAEREIWTACQLGSEASLAYNEAVTLKWLGELDETALRRALHWVVDRHPSLRTSFSSDGEATMHSTPAEVACSFEKIRAQEVQARLESEVSRPFDLEQAPLIRFSVLDTGSERLLVVCAHHIVCDGWSFAVLLGEIRLAYRAFLGGAAPEMPAAPNMRELAARREERKTRNREFWRGLYTDIPERLVLPCDRERPARRGFSSRRLDHPLSPGFVARLKDIGQRNGCSLFVTLLTGLSSWLHKVTGQSDQVICAAQAGQATCQVPGLVGHAVNTLPLRLKSQLDLSFVRALELNRRTLLDALEHADYTLTELLEDLRLPREADHPPLSPLLFNLDRALDEDVSSVPRVSENFELFLNAAERPDGSIFLEVQYSTELFREGQVSALLASFENHLESCMRSPDRSLRELDMLAERERKDLESEARSAQASEASSLAAFLHDGAEVSDLSGRRMKSTQLRETASRLEQGLRRAGLRDGHRIGVMMDRDVYLPAALLAVGASGAAYVPLDPNHPTARLKETAEDAELHSILSSRALAGQAKSLERPLLVLEDLLAEDLPARPLTLPDAHAPAYVLYTSGSTGKSKGVVISHGSVANFLLSMRERPGLDAGQKIAAITTLGFDIAGLELYLPLITGSRLLVIDRETARDGFRLLAALREEGVDVLQATPTTWRMLLMAGLKKSGLKLKALCGGEALPRELATELLDCGLELWNMYGPTETTIWSSCHRVTKEDLGKESIPIGAPVRNTLLCVLDDDGLPLPAGIRGEIAIGGAGLATGYWRNEKLTREKFIDHRLGRLYRTGDLGRRSPNGALHILGRRDLQVKVRGHRIEIGEIEEALARHPKLQQSAVAAVPVESGFELVAYFVARDAVSGAELRLYLSDKLPESHLPTRYHRLDHLPQTPNGKIDRVKLTAWSRDEQTPRTHVPRELSGQELRLADHWSTLLNRPSKEFHADSDFFMEGGHSVLAMRLVHRVQEEGLRLQLRDVFEAPRLGELATRMQPVSSAASQAIVLSKTREARVPLSLMQERLYYLDRLYPLSRAHHLPAAFLMKGPLDRARLERSVSELVRRHPALSFVVADDERGPWLDTRPLAPRLDFEPVSAGNLADRLAEEARRPFDLNRGPLFRSRVFELDKEQHVLCVVAHHLVFDGWSFDILLDDLSRLYQDLESALAPLNLEYRDFAAWQRQSLATLTELHADFWKQELEGLPSLSLPTDHPRPARLEYRGAMLEFSVPETLTAKLRTAAQSRGATLSMVLLSAFLLELRRWSGQMDFGVGLPVRGRPSPELEKVIGFFVNTIVLRSRAEEAETFGGYLDRIRQRCLQAFQHQDLPFEKIMEGRKRSADGQRTPLFQAFFSFQDTRNRDPRLGPLQLEQIHVHPGHVGTEISLWVKEGRHGILAGVDYSTELFEASSIQGFIERYQGLLMRVAQGLDFPLTEETRNHFDAPRSPSELALAALWSDLLGLSTPPSRSDYFFDVGGNSLLALRLMTSIERRFGVKVDAHSLLTWNLAQIASHCDRPATRGWRALLERWRRKGS